MNKIQKITKGKRDFFSPKGRQVDDLALDRIKSILADLEIRRDLLIEALHKVQDAYGYISAETWRHWQIFSNYLKLRFMR